MVVPAGQMRKYECPSSSFGNGKEKLKSFRDSQKIHIKNDEGEVSWRSIHCFKFKHRLWVGDNCWCIFLDGQGSLFIFL
jgi:hypothetical protein